MIIYFIFKRKVERVRNLGNARVGIEIKTRSHLFLMEHL
jgi:hypothetical protein